MSFSQFNWDKHAYFKKYDCHSYNHFAYESLMHHYSKYKYVITEVCLGQCSVTRFNECLFCQKEITRKIKNGKWNQKELKIVLTDCERFLFERYNKAVKENRYLNPITPYLKWKLDKPIYYKEKK